MSYSDFFSLDGQQGATISPLDLTLCDQTQHLTVQNNANGYIQQTVIDPAFDLGNWTWPDPLDVTPSPPPPQQSYEQTHSMLGTVVSTAGTMPFDPAAEPFGHATAVHEAAAQDGWIPADARARCDDPPALDKTEELMIMFAELEAKMEQRMTLIEEKINAVKHRLEDDTARLCEEVDDAISRLQTWTGQVREAVDDALRSCASS